MLCTLLLKFTHFYLFALLLGTEQYSKYSGYAESFKWKDNHKDEIPR